MAVLQPVAQGKALLSKDTLACPQAAWWARISRACRQGEWPRKVCSNMAELTELVGEGENPAVGEVAGLGRPKGSTNQVVCQVVLCREVVCKEVACREVAYKWAVGRREWTVATRAAAVGALVDHKAAMRLVVGRADMARLVVDRPGGVVTTAAMTIANAHMIVDRVTAATTTGNVGGGKRLKEYPDEVIYA